MRWWNSATSWEIPAVCVIPENKPLSAGTKHAAVHLARLIVRSSSDNKKQTRLGIFSDWNSVIRAAD